MFRGDLELRVQRALTEVRPGLVRDGGDVELVGIEDGVVRVRLLGSCAECPLAHDTVVRFIADRVHRLAPEIDRLVAE